MATAKIPVSGSGIVVQLLDCRITVAGASLVAYDHGHLLCLDKSGQVLKVFPAAKVVMATDRADLPTLNMWI